MWEWATGPSDFAPGAHNKASRFRAARIPRLIVGQDFRVCDSRDASLTATRLLLPGKRLVKPFRDISFLVLPVAN